MPQHTPQDEARKYLGLPPLPPTPGAPAPVPTKTPRQEALEYLYGPGGVPPTPSPPRPLAPTQTPPSGQGLPPKTPQEEARDYLFGSGGAPAQGRFSRALELSARPGQLGAGLVTDRQAGLRGLVTGKMGLGDIIAMQEAKEGIAPRVGELLFDPLNIAGIGLIRGGIKGVRGLGRALGRARPPARPTGLHAESMPARMVGEDVATGGIARRPTLLEEAFPRPDEPARLQAEFGGFQPLADMLSPLERAAGTVGLTLPKSMGDVGRGLLGAVKPSISTEELRGITPGGIVRGLPGAALEVGGLVPRAALTMGEHSAVLRQGAVSTVMHPGRAREAFAASMRTLFSEDNAQAIDEARRASPGFDEAMNAKLFHGDIAGGLVKGEETFLSKFAQRIPMVRASNRIFVTYLNELRHLTFNEAVKGWEETGRVLGADAIETGAKKLGLEGRDALRAGAKVEVGQIVNKAGRLAREGEPGLEWTDEMAQLASAEQTRYDHLSAWGQFVTHVTGRGALPSGDTLNRVLSLAFFAPRLLVSYPQTVFDLVRPMKGLPYANPVRAKIARDLVGSVGLGTSILTMLHASGAAEVSANPFSSDFGKVRIGNQRFNIWAGYQPIARLVAGGIMNAQTDISLGDTTKPGRARIVGGFLSTKLSPLGGLVRDLIPLAGGKRPENFIGERMVASVSGAKKEALDRLIPLFWQDAVNAAELEGWRGSVRSAPGVLGVGTQTFKTAKERYYTELGGKGRLMEQGEATKRWFKEKWERHRPQDERLFRYPWEKAPKRPFLSP